MTAARLGRWTLAAVVLCGGCGGDSAGGPAVAELQTSVADPSGHTTNAYCTVLPVLLGGRARAEIDVAGEFSMLIEGNNDLVLISFDGVHDATELELAIDAGTLRAGYSESLEVTTTRERRFTVRLSSRCTP
ncbi:MAG TPA: hypothetical protein VI197_03715 [Polyangiaceae bacterium]